jgi:hypothetical protein
MHRSALNAEVQYHLKKQELERNRHVVEMDEKKSFLHRLLAIVAGRQLGDAPGRGRADGGLPAPGRYHEQKQPTAP